LNVKHNRGESIPYRIAIHSSSCCCHEQLEKLGLYSLQLFFLTKSIKIAHTLQEFLSLNDFLGLRKESGSPSSVLLSSTIASQLRHCLAYLLTRSQPPQRCAREFITLTVAHINPARALNGVRQQRAILGLAIILKIFNPQQRKKSVQNANAKRKRNSRKEESSSKIGKFQGSSVIYFLLC